MPPLHRIPRGPAEDRNGKDSEKRAAQGCGPAKQMTRTFRDLLPDSICLESSSPLASTGAGPHLLNWAPAWIQFMQGPQGEIMSTSIEDIPVKKITGEDTSLAEFKGRVLLVVNVASTCGLTPQYEGLEKIYEQFKGQGLVIAGFPANDFKSQEPGTRSEE